MKIKSVYFSKAVTLPGSKVLGAMGIYPEKFPGVKLTLIPEGLIIEDTAITALIPLASINHIIFYPEEKPTPKE